MSISRDLIAEYISHTLTETNLPIGQKLHTGKVRDTYEINGERVIITTDRQSAFDRVLAAIPFKGQVLNRLAAFWFQNTKDIVKNHLQAIPHPNVLVAQKATVFPVEMVIRGYITGSTNTSAWVNYEKGVRNFCGNTLPEGLQKNEKFPEPIITPTTKPETGHDENIEPEEIIARGYMTREEWEFVSQKTRAIFERGQEICAKNGLILVDTKYEFGKTEDGKIILIDEVHTPDSSRFWDMESYAERFEKGEEPKSFDKDVLRRWYAKNCDPYATGDLPTAPEELIVDVAEAYMEAYEKITGTEFVPHLSKNPEESILEALQRV
ncbi:MAG: phosphoribosylaminoimidazolesuccinocarboxamide synthase [Candidatus Peregrinibacteria bacterium]